MPDLLSNLPGPPPQVHSDGPWEMVGNPRNLIIQAGPDERVCYLASSGSTTANGRLIAAAPDMLAALRDLMSIRPSNWDDGDDPDLMQAYSAAEAAIAKALEGASDDKQ